MELGTVLNLSTLFGTELGGYQYYEPRNYSLTNNLLEVFRAWIGTLLTPKATRCELLWSINNNSRFHISPT